MKIQAFLCCLFFAACQSKTPAPAPAPAPAPPVLAPISAPATTLAATEPVIEPLSAPVSEPSSIAAVMEEPEEAGPFFYTLELTDKSEDNVASFLVRHPDPGVQKMLNDLLEKDASNRGCTVTAATTAIFSFFCFHEAEDTDGGDPNRVGDPANYSAEYKAESYAIINGALKRLRFEELVNSESPAMKAWLKENELENEPDRTDNFAIDFKGEALVFYAHDVYYGTADPVEMPIDDEGLVRAGVFPLSTIAKTKDPADFDLADLASLAGGLSSSSFEAKELPPEMSFEGDFVQGLRWHDSKGENYFILSRYERRSKDGSKLSKYVYANRYIKSSKLTPDFDGSAEPPFKLRAIIDQEEKCALTNLAGFVDGSLLLSDLDHNGVGEVSVAYRLGCIDAPAPVFLKLLLLEGDDKYILRGTTRLSTGAGGDLTPSYTFPAGPKVFLDFATARWKELYAHPATPASAPTSITPLSP